MTTYGGSVLRKCVYLTLLVSIVAAREVCDKKNCPGPLRYYEGLNCTPVYENPGDCCAVEYNCEQARSLAKDKCYVNGHEYSIGEKLKEEDANPCDVGCTCNMGHGDVAKFNCGIVDCFYGPPLPPNCYRRKSPSQCCQGEQVCLAEGETRPTCEVDGKTYKDGEYFSPKSDPELECYCMPGYKGENVEPFCKKLGHPYCSAMFSKPHDIHNNCAPVYYSNQRTQTDCSVSSRCQNRNDTVIHNHESGKSAESSEESRSTCKYGDMELHIGDELNQATGYESVCVKCVCEVPPVLTCQRLPDNECDVTVHPPFDSYQ